MRYHSTVTSGLQAIIRLIRKSPYVVQLEVPVHKALAIAERQVKRYPSITQTHTTRTALRKVNLPVIQLVVMPPNGQTITLFLLSNQVPPDTRETWSQALDPTTPLTWRNYELTQLEDGRISWRLSRQVRERYGVQLTRLITGRGGVRQVLTPGGMRRQAKYQLRPEVAYTQVLKLAAHLGQYPGLAGVRRDVFALAQQSTRLWQSTHPQRPYPVWPYQPYLPYRTPRMAPLSDLQEGVFPGGVEGGLDPRHPQPPHPEGSTVEVAQ
jgi:hypothetical protein